MYINSQFISVPIFNQLVPNEGPKTVKVTCDFDGVDIYTVDMNNAVESGMIVAAQSFYFDASKLVKPVIINIDGSSQQIKILPETQGYIPALIPNPPSFTIKSESATGSLFSLNLLNVPMPIGVWSTKETV